MKKRKMKRFLVLASCAMLMTGCESDALWGLGGKWNQVVDWAKNLLGLNKEEKKSDDDGKGGEEKKEAGISLKELPKYGFVGETLNLDSYVQLTNATSYTVSLAESSKAFASVSGHVLSFKEEGKVDFTVTADSKSASGSLESIRESRLALMDYVEGVEQRYTVAELGYVQTAGEDTPDDESDDEYDIGYVDVLFHSDLYLLTLASWDQDEETGEAIPGGFLKFSEDDEDAFYFSLSYDEEAQEEVVALGEKTSSMILDYYNGPLGLDFSTMKYELYHYEDEDTGEVEEYDQYILEDEDAMAFAENSLLIPYGCIDGSAGNYPINKVEFTLEVEEDEVTGEEYSVMVAYTYTTVGDEPYFWSMHEIYVDEEDVGYPLLEEFCVPENKPEGEDYWNYFHPQIGLGDFFLSPDGIVGTAGIINIKYGWVDDEGNAIDCPSDATTGNLFAYMPVGSDIFVMSANSIWQVDETYAPISGKMAVTSEDEEPVTTVYNIFSAETESGFLAEEADDGVWDGAEVFSGLADRENYPRGAIGEVEELSHEEAGETEEDPATTVYDGTAFYFYQGYANGFIDTLVAGDQGLFYLGAIINAWASTQDLYKFFSATLIVNEQYGVVNLIVSFGWGDNENWQVSFTSMYYPDAASMAASYESFMLSNVINVGA